MFNKQRYRNIQSLLLLSTILVLGTALYLEHIQGLQPCPLCLMQRLATFLFGTLCLIGMCLSTLKRAKHVAFAQIIITAMGLFFAGRQLWLQSLPVDQAPACMPNLDMLVHYFSKTQVLTALLWGTGDCADVSLRYFGLSIPVWSLVYFVTMFAVSGFVFWSLGRRVAEIEHK